MDRKTSSEQSDSSISSPSLKKRNELSSQNNSQSPDSYKHRHTKHFSRSRSKSNERSYGYHSKTNVIQSRLANLNLRNGITKNDRSTIIEIAIFQMVLQCHSTFLQKLKQILSFLQCYTLLKPRNIQNDSEELLQCYKKYQQQWEQKQNQIFFTEHKSEEWFEERYDAVMIGKLKAEQKELARKAFELFMKRFEKGEFEAIDLAAGQELCKEENLFSYDPFEQTLFIKSIPKFISRWKLKEIFDKLPGFVQLAVSYPSKLNDFSRLGWILFENERFCSEAEVVLKELILKDFQFNIVKVRPNKNQQNISKALTLANLEEDRVKTKELIEQLDKEKQLDNNKLLHPDLNYPLTKTLDLQLIYLRKVHHYCYYCGLQFENERLLINKCASCHLRLLNTVKQQLLVNYQESSNEDEESNSEWHSKIIEAANKRISESKENQEEEIGESLIYKRFERVLHEQFLEKKEKFASWPCLYCKKIFKEEHFLVKHIETKHNSDKLYIKEQEKASFYYKFYQLKKKDSRNIKI